MSRIRRGWELTKKSWALLREHPALIRFPLYGAAATIICAVIVLGPGIYLISDDGNLTALRGHPVAARAAHKAPAPAAPAAPAATETPPASDAAGPVPAPGG